MGAKVDLVGQRFGRLVVIEQDGVRNKRPAWLCKCDCGNTNTVAGSSLRQQVTVSCGCVRLERATQANTKHGGVGTREYRIWCLMHGRCNSPSNPRYKHYGGRGIKVCERWNSFPNFLADMGVSPTGYSIERVDNNAGYGPDNCIWADQFAQTVNRRKGSNNTTGVVGVYRDRGSWRAMITRMKKTHYIGNFSSIEDAIAARKEAEQRFDSRPLGENSTTGQSA